MFFRSRAARPLPAKVTGPLGAWPESGCVHAIVCVATPGHVPPAMTLRTRIDPTLFTAEFDVAALDDIVADPDVLSVAAARPMPPVRSGGAAP